MGARKLFIFISLFLFTAGCATVSGRRPSWMTKRINSSDILEGVGYSPVESDKRSARDAAYSDALQKLTLAGEVEVKGYLESRLYSSRDFPGREKGDVLLDSVNKAIFNTILGKKYFEEYYDGSAKEYWVYVYLPVSATKRISAEEGIKLLDNEAKKPSVNPEMKKSLESIRKDLEADLDKYKSEEDEESKRLEGLIPK